MWEKQPAEVQICQYPNMKLSLTKWQPTDIIWIKSGYGWSRGLQNLHICIRNHLKLGLYVLSCSILRGRAWGRRDGEGKFRIEIEKS